MHFLVVHLQKKILQPLLFLVKVHSGISIMYDLSCGFSQINNFYALFKNCDHSFWRMTCWNTLHILPYSMFENPKFLYKVARKFLVFVWRIKCGKICSDSTGVIPPSINLFFLKCLWWHFQKSHRPKKNPFISKVLAEKITLSAFTRWWLQHQSSG